MMSSELAAGAGTTTRTGLLGQAWAEAEVESASAKASESSFFMVSPVWLASILAGPMRAKASFRSRVTPTVC